jgi:two-component system, chemotaxis family, chemotaxis protein CheY
MYDRILIVDDSVTARMMIKRCLEIAGYENAAVLEASNGAEAIERLKNDGADLILTDLNMPQMNGKTLIRRLKCSPKFFHIPIVVISSITNTGEEEDLIAGGVAAVMRKPLSPTSFMEVIETLKAKEREEDGHAE